ncbi:MAG TPA: hypothetical protein PKB10_05770, partial [Tepidisphaeraceae bacterium]|nr:hypothetical protein [Tepidisphaeraceae bacterium]
MKLSNIGDASLTNNRVLLRSKGDGLGMGVPRRSWLRSAGIGLCGVALIALFTPFNDYALGNTPFIGNALPLIVVLALVGLACLINGPLNKWTPRYRLSRGEMVVILGMLLVGSALPSSGLMRYLPGAIVTPIGRADSEDLDWRGG